MTHHPETLTASSAPFSQTSDHARTLAHEGERHRLAGRLGEALAAFDQAIELEPEYTWALAHRGEVYRLAGRCTEALADFNRAIPLKPDYAWALAHRGAVYRLMQRAAEALADLNRSLDLLPDNAWALIYRAETFVILKQYEEALVDFDRALALGQLPLSHQQGERGMLTNYLGRYAETVTCCEQALVENPTDYMALYSRAVARVCTQGLPQARTEIEAALTILLAILYTGPEMKTRAGILYRLGGLAALQGEVDQALDYLQEAIPLDYEPIEQARHDPAWRDLSAHPRYRALVAGTGWEKQS